MIKFTPNIQKIIEAILWIVNKRPGIGLYHVMKIVFAADCWHLSNYGRPVTGDFYVAVKHGTMPSIAKDIIDNDPLTFSEYGINEPVVSRNGHLLYATRAFDRSKFSKSDLEALEYGFYEYADVPTFSAVRKKNHQHPAWVKAAEKEGYDISQNTDFSRLHRVIDFLDMVDNEEMRRDLSELGESTEAMIV
jgi:hypothetical protein